jgi:hypothetical protein
MLRLDSRRWARAARVRWSCVRRAPVRARGKQPRAGKIAASRSFPGQTSRIVRSLASAGNGGRADERLASPSHPVRSASPERHSGGFTSSENRVAASGSPNRSTASHLRNSTVDAHRPSSRCGTVTADAHPPKPRFGSREMNATGRCRFRRRCFDIEMSGCVRCSFVKAETTIGIRAKYPANAPPIVVHLPHHPCRVWPACRTVLRQHHRSSRGTALRKRGARAGAHRPNAEEIAWCSTDPTAVRAHCDRPEEQRCRKRARTNV